MNKILVVVDMQNDFITGALGSKEAQEILPAVFQKIEAAADNDDFVIFTQDTHFKNYLETQEGKRLPVPHCIKGTYGWEVCNELLQVEGLNCTFLEKLSFGSLAWNDYVDEEVDEIELIGVCTDICVVSNALILKAMFPDLLVSVDIDCCAGVTPEFHNAAAIVMKSCQVNVIGG